MSTFRKCGVPHCLALGAWAVVFKVPLFLPSGMEAAPMVLVIDDLRCDGHKSARPRDYFTKANFEELTQTAESRGFRADWPSISVEFHPAGFHSLLRAKMTLDQFKGRVR